MKPHVHAELLRLGFPIPRETRYTVRCRWRPPKDHWKLIGPQWREVIVVIKDTGRPQDAACNACLYLIAMRRGKAEAIELLRPRSQQHMIQHTTFNWSWYDGVVTWGGDFVSEECLEA